MLSRDLDIINMFLDGYLIEDIARSFSCNEEDILEIIIKYRAARIIKYTNSLESDEDIIKVIGEYIKENLEKVKERSRDERKRINSIVSLTEEGMTLENIANAFSLSRERIRQIIANYAPELTIAKDDNRYKICDVCGERKKGVRPRNGVGMICTECYKKTVEESKKRWSNEYDKCIDCGTINNPHRSKGRCSKCNTKYLYYYDLNRKKQIKKSGEKWRNKNKDRVREINKRASAKALEKSFGGNRSKALERDGFKCTNCGLTLEDSIKKYSRDLYVCRLGGLNKNNLNNLVTLCALCHNNRFRQSRSHK